ncbi:MAG: ATP-binding response regulator [Ktedonobacteraceae bacterium]
MDETPALFHEEDLSEEDLAVLRDFDAMEFIVGEQLEENPENPQNAAKNVSQSGLSQADTTEAFSQEEMLLLFVSEVEEDISVLRNGIQLVCGHCSRARGARGEQKLAPTQTLDGARLDILERKAHKIKGTAGAFGCSALSTIARHTETLIRLITQGKLDPSLALQLLTQAIGALESTLDSLVTTGEESPVPLNELEAAFTMHSLATVGGDIHTSSSPPHTLASKPKLVPELATAPVSVRVELARFEQLLLHTGELADLQTPLRSAQEQVESALQELHAAQARLTRLESRYSTFPLSASGSASTSGRQGGGVIRPASSMIASILNEAEERLGREYERKEQRHSSQTRQSSSGEPLYWDELEIDRYTETDALKNVLSEAIADVAAASAQLRSAFALLNEVLQKQTTSAIHVRSDTLSLRLTPLSALLGRIERVIAMNDDAQRGQQDYQSSLATPLSRLAPLSKAEMRGSIHFEMRGETTEIDQEMLEELKNPLLRLARACVSPGVQAEGSSGFKEVTVWFHAADLGNEVAIELGSSMNIESGAVDEVQDTLRRLHGTIMVLRNSAGGMSFHLRLPRSQGALRGLLVQTGTQHVIVPFAQIQHIDYGLVEDEASIYALSNLLGLSAVSTFRQDKKQMCPVLVLYPESSQLRVQVERILGDIEHVVKPLPPYLQRPGIAGTVIDDGGNVLLVVNLADLIRHTPQQRLALQAEQLAVSSLSKSQQKVVLVADDSVSIRGSLLQTLASAGYRAIGVDDGMKALDFLLDHAPDVLLLDIEMPYLNGYDLLSIMSAHEHLANVKTVMLTSRSSEKHRQRALELGAAAYLTKPCPHDVLLATLKSLVM